jgi:hypothetical protein
MGAEPGISCYSLRNINTGKRLRGNGDGSVSPGDCGGTEPQIWGVPEGGS